MRKVSTAFFYFLIFIISSYAAKPWWTDANFYQIYPRSFRDSNGDGVGDLNGITEKLPYLKEIGITAAWISPIFKSPMADFGYDIADYRVIHPEFGAMEDFENLIKRAKELGVKILLDFVPNHTSDESEWFKKSVRREGDYTDYYIWHDGIPDSTAKNGRRPPNNWLSVFRYSAWEWNDDRQQFYLHQFAVKQPDLNYRNKKVVQEMKDIMTFWLKKGISGFRIDAVPFLFEVDKDQNGNYPDEPKSGACDDPTAYCYLIHSLTNDQPETFDMAYQWRELAENFKKEYGGDDKVLMTEAYTTLENTIRFYGNGIQNGSHVPFNFEMINHLNGNSNAVDFSKNIDSWLEKTPKDVRPNWVLGNHDNKRVASRYGKDRADLINILLQTLPGIAVTYNGEELAFTDVHISWEETVDPQACNADRDKYEEASRDPARTPFQWDASKFSGFTTGTGTWLPVSPDYKTNNVLMQMRAPYSHLHIFKKLLKLRKEPSFTDGELDKKTIGQDILIYKRELKGDDIYIIVLNFGQNNQVIDLTSQFSGIGSKVEVITTSVQSAYTDGDVISSSSVTAYGRVGTVFVALK